MVVEYFFTQQRYFDIAEEKKLFSTIHANTKYKHWKIDFNSLVLCSQQENNEL